MTPYKIGIDGGGSKTHAILIDKNYNIIDEKIAGPANLKTNINESINSITESINYLIYKHNLNNDISIGIGVAGFSDQANLQILKKNLKQFYSKITITSDAHIACLAAHSGQDGGVIVCGTGVVGYKQTNGIGIQLSGWGFPQGDLGGGAWIGLEICRALCKAIDKTTSFSPLLNATFCKFNENVIEYKNWLLNAKPQNYAEIARLFPEFVLQKDSLALEILQRGTFEINSLITAINQKNIAITGGLANFYYPYLKTNHAQLKISRKNNALGACYIS